MREDVVDLAACPTCRGTLRHIASELECTSCHRAYGLRSGVPELLVDPVAANDPSPSGAGRLLHAVVAKPRVYDVVQRLAGSERLLRRLRNALAPAAGALVLDVGAGTGNLESALPPSARYLWLEPDVQKLAGFVAKSNAPGVLGDATNIPLKDQSVDWAVSVGVSHHLDEAQFGAMLDEIRRVTRYRFVFLDALVTPAMRSRLLWRYDRGRHPRTADRLLRELASRFEILSEEQFAILHRYLLVTAG